MDLKILIRLDLELACALGVKHLTAKLTENGFGIWSRMGKIEKWKTQ